MSRCRHHRLTTALAVAALVAVGHATAQAGPDDPSMDDMSMPDMPGMDMATMPGAFGSYPMTRESSGTSWQPDLAAHPGIEFSAGPWNLMAHGMVDLIDDHQGGPRGGTKDFSGSMAMLMAQRAVGDASTWGLRAMLSLDPLMGARGYPLLFATGETADGRTPLVDRQHPHNLFMELSTSYSYRPAAETSLFIYAGLPGEPALGPPAFMHRPSGMDNPEAPITHHWLDSTHITNGVLTGGLTLGTWKLEGSVFNGREPDQHRYAINQPKLDSVAARLSWNPDPHWSLQTSWGYLKSPEQLQPTVNENRLTASAAYVLPFDANDWATTFAWGRKMDRPGRTLEGFLLESELVLHDRDTVFARAERVGEDELFDGSPILGGKTITVGKVSIGYIHDFGVADHTLLGLGGLVSRYAYPPGLDIAYGSDPTSYMLFIRVKIG